MSETIELKVSIDRKLYYDDKSSFGVFAMTPVSNKKSVDLNKYGNFVVNGNCPELLQDSEYDIVIEPSVHKKYGKGYSFVKVNIKKPTTVGSQQTYLRAIVREDLAGQLIAKYPNELILDLIKEDKIDFSDIKGMRQATFDKVKSDLFKNIEIQEAIVELGDLNISFNAMKKLIEHYGSPSLVVQKVKTNIYSLCEVKYFGFIKVDQYAMNRGDDKNDPNRVKASFMYLLKEEENKGHCWISEAELIDTARDLLKIDIDIITNVLKKTLSNKLSNVIKIEGRIAIKSIFEHEKYIMEKLYKLVNSENKFKIKKFDEKIKNIEKQQGFSFTSEQLEAINLAVDNDVFLLNGKGGVGKTATLKGILGVLDTYSHVACALSGKASKIMSDHNLNAKTIHRMLGVSKKGEFIHNEQYNLDEDIVVIDEASMCSGYLFYSVVSAIKNGSKLIIVGDSGQLSSIGSSSIFDDLLRSQSFPMKELKEVQRQAAKSGILSQANKIRDGHQVVDRYDYKKRVYGELNDFVLFPMENKHVLKDMVLDICKSYKGNNDEFQVLCGLKSKGELSVKNLNVELQQIFNDTSTPFIKRGDYEYYVNDRIIHNGNNYEAGKNEDVQIFNGTIGKIVKVNKSDNKIDIKFEGIGDVITYGLKEMEYTELAYAITVHKSQGSTIKNVLFTFDYGSYMLLSKQFVYTGISRSAKACVVVCEMGALHHAIKTDHGSLRRTFLLSLLRGEIQGGAE